MLMSTKRKLLLLTAMPLLLVTVACAGAFAPTEISSDQLLDPSPNPSLGGTLPAETAYRFTLPSVPGGSVSLASYAGEQNIVLVFYRGFW